MGDRTGGDVRCITIRQPWATLCAHGTKTIETRTRRTHYRGPVAIHAGLNMADHWRIWEHGHQRARSTEAAVVSALDALDLDLDPLDGDNILPTGAIIAVAQLVDCLPISDDPDRNDHYLLVDPRERRAMGMARRLVAGRHHRPSGRPRRPAPPGRLPARPVGLAPHRPHPAPRAHPRPRPTGTLDPRPRPRRRDHGEGPVSDPVEIPATPPGTSRAPRGQTPGELVRWRICDGEAAIVLGHDGHQRWVRIHGPLGPAEAITANVHGRILLIAGALDAAHQWLASSLDPAPGQPTLWETTP